MNAPSELVPLNVSVSHPSQAMLSRGPAAALELVNEFVVDSDETFDLAGEELLDIKAKHDKLDTQRKGITKPLDEAKKAVMDLYRGPIEALEEAERILKGKMLGYQREQQLKAEADRLEREKAAQAERDRLADEAKKLDEQGRSGEAEVKRTVADMVVAVPVQSTTRPATKGISTSTTIDYEVHDMLELVKHIAAHPELIGLVVADSVKLRNYVRGLGMACKLPGVRVFGKQTMSARK